MKFMLMIIDDEAAQARLSKNELDELFHQVGAIEERLKVAGKMIDSRALRPGVEAVTVRMSDGMPRVHDGPFAETKEVLGGFFIIECDSKDEAVTWAREFPPRGLAAIEVRPIWEMS